EVGEVGPGVADAGRAQHREFLLCRLPQHHQVEPVPGLRAEEVAGPEDDDLDVARPRRRRVLRFHALPDLAARRLRVLRRCRCEHAFAGRVVVDVAGEQQRLAGSAKCLQHPRRLRLLPALVPLVIGQVEGVDDDVGAGDGGGDILGPLRVTLVEADARQLVPVAPAKAGDLPSGSGEGGCDMVAGMPVDAEDGDCVPAHVHISLLLEKPSASTGMLWNSPLLRYLHTSMYRKHMTEPDWSLWRSFAAVVAEGSLSAAARRLGLSQPTLGRHVEALERALDVTLFERTLQGLRPTDTALRLYEPVAAAQRA